MEPFILVDGKPIDETTDLAGAKVIVIERDATAAEIEEQDRILLYGDPSALAPIGILNAAKASTDLAILDEMIEAGRPKIGPVTPRGSLGRNDRCRCGSGRKAKKCCRARTS